MAFRIKSFLWPFIALLCLSIAWADAGENMTVGVLGWWSLDGTANDISNGTNYSMTNTGGMAYTNLAVRGGGSQTFNDESKYLNHSDAAFVMLNDFTVGCWFNRTDNSEYQSMIGKMDGAGNQGFYLGAKKQR